MAQKIIEAMLRIKTDTSSASANLGKMSEQLQAGLGKVEQTIANMKSQMLGFLGVAAGAAGVKSLAELADAYSSLNARLRVATRSQQEFDAARAQSSALAKQYLQPLGETVTLYTRLLRAVIPLGGGTREAQVATEALLASIKINGSTAAEAGSAIIQFSQALGAGALRGEEFNAVAEAATPLLDALAAGLGKPRDQLKSLAEQGKLTTGAVIEALSRQLPKLREQAAQIPATISGAAQQAGDAFRSFVGAGAQGSEVVRTVIGMIRLLGENIEPIIKGLTALGVLIGALRLAAFAQGLAVAGATAAAGASGLAAFGLALRGISFALSGPVGLIVLVGTLAAAWLGLDAAQRKAQQRSVDSLKADRARLVSELDKFEESHGKGNGAGMNWAAFQRTKIRQLDEQIAAAERAREDALRAAGGPRGRTDQAELRDPQTIANFEQEYQTRLAVEKRFADQRAAYTKAVDLEIAAARARGDADAERRLLATKKGSLAIQAKAEADALRAFDKDSVNTRFQQVKDLYDQRADLVKDALEREVKANEDAYAKGLVDVQQYMAERSRLEADQYETDLRLLQDQLAKQRAAYARNVKLPTAGLDANQRAERQEALIEQLEKINRLEADIEKRRRDRADATNREAQDESNLTQELMRQRRELDLQMTEAMGANLSDQQINDRVEASFRDLRDRLRKLGMDEGPVLTLIDVEVTRQKLAQVERDYQRTMNDLQQREAAINQDLAAGRLTSSEAEQRIVNLRREEVQLLDQILERAQALAQSPEERQRIQGYRNQLQQLRDLRTELESTAQSAATNSLKTFFNDIETGSKRGKDALLDMVRSFAQAMLDVLNKQLAEALVKQAIDAWNAFKANSGSSSGSGWGAALGSWLATLFHTGGVVGEGGGVRRAIAPAAYALAPRYHSGGIAGLRTGEVPAILMKGEEVLTADDPRHRNNLGRAGAPVVGAVNVSVSTQGTGSSNGDQTMGQRLGGAIKVAVQGVIVDEMRPGGILQHVAR